MITLLRASYQDIERVAEYAGLSTDNKTDPSYFVELKNGDVFKEIDTGNIYKYNGTTNQWVLQPASGGGGNGDTGVVSFNGRTGVVVPVATDYPPSLIGAVSKAGDTMTGDLNMGGHTVTGISDALESTDALPKGQADDIYVNVTGDTMTGPLNMGNNKITMGGTPTETTDVTNKGYVDGVVEVISTEVDKILDGTSPVAIPAATATKAGLVRQATAVPDAEGATDTTLAVTVNNLLAALRTAGILASD